RKSFHDLPWCPFRCRQGSCWKAFTSQMSDQQAQALPQPFFSYVQRALHCRLIRMLSNTLYRVPRHTGLQPLQKRGEGGATEMTSWRLYLEAGGREQYFNGAEETILVVQQGSGTVSAAGLTSRVSRGSVFTDRATALYLPAGLELTVTAEDA